MPIKNPWGSVGSCIHEAGVQRRDWVRDTTQGTVSVDMAFKSVTREEMVEAEPRLEYS